MFVWINAGNANDLFSKISKHWQTPTLFRLYVTTEWTIPQSGRKTNKNITDLTTKFVIFCLFSCRNNKYWEYFFENKSFEFAMFVVYVLQSIGQPVNTTDSVSMQNKTKMKWQAANGRTMAMHNRDTNFVWKSLVDITRKLYYREKNRSRVLFALHSVWTRIAILSRYRKKKYIK